MCCIIQFLQDMPKEYIKDRSKVYLAVVGSRSINDYELVKIEIDNLLLEQNIDKTKLILVSGGANGVDRLVRVYAKEFNIPIIEITPDWKTYGKSAGPLRNREIVKLSDLVLAIWDGKSTGTLSTINFAKYENKYVKVIKLI